MKTCFCPFCWQEIEESATRCAQCKADITQAQKRNFEEKLLNALGHKLPDTVEMAVWILGELQSGKAIPPLTALLKRTESYQLKCMILDALDKIGTDVAISAIRETFARETGLVRKKAGKLLEHTNTETNNGHGG
ncbi:MAG: HEAT repeat domain-containing protein [Desulfobulbaceae bacterium]|nr:HEAT repeat domain-containing protein [Desulfobulbaceae bacterium]